jgi:hypothetical protein
MRKLTIATAMLAVLGLGFAATLASDQAARALALAEGFSPPAFALEQVASHPTVSEQASRAF